MEERIEKTEARQGERKRWQERTLLLSLGGAAIVLALAMAVFLGFS